MNWANKAFRWYFAQRYKRIQHFMQRPQEVQHTWFAHLISTSKHTEWGKIHHYRSIKTPTDFVRQVPIQDYETLKPYIERMMMGEKDVLWSGAVRWFSKSSDTTNDKSKFIPVTNQNLQKCHIKGSWDAMTLLYQEYTDMEMFLGKSLIMGGSHQSFATYPKTQIGDISAIMLHHFPIVGRPFCTPDFETALLPNFEEKIERIAKTIIHENIAMVGGVPTWTVVLFNRILELTGKNNILEVFPNLKTYIHGGVSFLPYQEQFKQFLPSEDMIYQEIYNASEGYFAVRSHFDTDDLLLLLDNGIYYEFLPQNQWYTAHPVAIPLEEVRLGEEYALVISTNGGLWRYTPGDTVTFTSLLPYKIKITGRTKQFVNAFGEEVIVSNTDKALAETCHLFGAMVADYTVAPIYFNKNEKGGHEWLVEFETPPKNMEDFNNVLDKKLQDINSDYEAKRHKSMALDRLRLRALPRGTFHQWLKAKGKFGGQSKVPRLANHRNYVEEILTFVGERNWG